MKLVLNEFYFHHINETSRYGVMMLTDPEHTQTQGQKSKIPQ